MRLVQVAKMRLAQVATMRLAQVAKKRLAKVAKMKSVQVNHIRNPLVAMATLVAKATLEAKAMVSHIHSPEHTLVPIKKEMINLKEKKLTKILQNIEIASTYARVKNCKSE